ATDVRNRSPCLLNALHIDERSIPCWLLNTHSWTVLCKLFSRGISILLAVGTPSTGSGKLYCQWELSSSSGNALCILFPTLVRSLD
nr:hypothetical protein [Tanacetum cinerariifolium]